MVSEWDSLAATIELTCVYFAIELHSGLDLIVF